MIDYIFYRVYWAYNKKRESAKFLSPLYMAMVFAFLFFPFALFLCELLRDSYHRNDGYLLSIYLLMILIYSYLRFFPNKKIWLINKKFEGNGYNYKIPDWCFFVVLPLSIVWGIITQDFSSSPMPNHYIQITKVNNDKIHFWSWGSSHVYTTKNNYFNGIKQAFLIQR